MKQLNSYLCLGQQIASFSCRTHVVCNWQLIEWRLRFFTHWQMGLDCAKVWNGISITAGTAGKRRWKVKQENDENCCERQVWKVCPRSSAHLCSRVQKVALTSDVYIYIWMMDVSLARYIYHSLFSFPRWWRTAMSPMPAHLELRQTTPSTS